MKKHRYRKRLIVLVMIACLLMSAVSVYGASTNVWVTGQTIPTTIKQGSGFTIKGTVRCNKRIRRVEIGITTAGGGKWLQRHDRKKLNCKTYSIKNADKKIRFGKLSPGTYIYRVYVHTSDGKVFTPINEQFTVVSKNAAATTTPAAQTSTPVATQPAATTAPSANVSSSSSTIRLSGVNKPATYNVGQKFNIKGTISSDDVINKVEVGIVVCATNKWTDYKYTANVGSKSFDLSRAASTLKFDKLPGGDFRYRVYAHTSKGVVLVLNEKFTVIPSNKPQLAVNWAKNIAADDSFTYGAKPAANAIGCYFCGTNCGPVKKYKPAGYEKTYVCMTFIGAAYAHGAGDPEILKKCQTGKMTMYETNDNFKVFSCWMKIGSCKDLTVNDLQPGDVIIKWSDKNDNNGHCCMYVGGDYLVESTGGGWGANSIAVKTGAASRLKSLSSNSKNYVMRYTK